MRWCQARRARRTSAKRCPTASGRTEGDDRESAAGSEREALTADRAGLGVDLSEVGEQGGRDGRHLGDEVRARLKGRPERGERERGRAGIGRACRQADGGRDEKCEGEDGAGRD